MQHRKIRTTLTAYFIILFSSMMFSQSGGIYIGIAVDDNLDRARSAAYNILVQQIQVTVSSSMNRTVNETARQWTDSTIQMTMSQSIMMLTDVEERVENLPDNSFRVTKSVSRESVQKMFLARRQAIFDYAKESQALLTGKSSNDFPMQTILTNFYRAYLLTAVYPDTITFPFNGSSSSSIVVGVPNAIDQIIASLRFIPVKKIDDEYVVWKYRVEYLGKPVSSMRYSYFDGMGQADAEVQNGETQLTLYYDSKEKKERTVQIQPEYLFESELDELQRSIESTGIAGVLKKKVTIDVPAEKPAEKPVEKTPEVVPELKKEIVVPSLPFTIAHLANRLLTGDQFKEELSTLRRKGVIVTGKAKDFESTEGLYALVFGPAGVTALLRTSKDGYYDFISQKKVEMKEFAGMGVIWFELLK